MIEFYFHPTPNPMKVALLLEELNLEYQVVPVDTLKGEQHLPDYLAINPNAKLPAIVDDGEAVFDANAILLYLAEKYGKSLLGENATRGDLLSWLMFIASGLGPFSGQAVHFQHMAPEQIPYAINRFRKEAQRHYSILNNRLSDRNYLVGESYTIVDIAAWGWIDRVKPVLGEGELSNYPNLLKWFNLIDERPAVAKARLVGTEIEFKKDRDEEANKALFPQNYD